MEREKGKDKDREIIFMWFPCGVTSQSVLYRYKVHTAHIRKKKKKKEANYREHLLMK